MVKKSIFLLTFLVTVFISCSDHHHSSKNVINDIVTFDLDSIRKKGKLVAITDFNSTNYFIYKGEPMGFNYELLKSFSDNIGIDLEIIAENNPEHAFGMLKSGEADLLAIDANATYYQDIDVSTPIGFPQCITWGVRKNNSSALLFELNRWIAKYKKAGSYALLYAKYFKNSRYSSINRSDFYVINAGKVSQFDDLIRKFSTSIKWDWRLLASLICQESHFNPNVESYKGAFGLMQIMPVTGENFGIDITSSPENNLKAGIRYINWLHSIFDPKIPDEKERINFILAAYNAGPGHVLDAMKLAEKNGMNPRKWDGNVAIWLLKKSERQYYNDIVVKNGYFRGTESVNFVSQVLERFEHYKNIIPKEKSNPF